MVQSVVNQALPQTETMNFEGVEDLLKYFKMRASTFLSDLNQNQSGNEHKTQVFEPIDLNLCHLFSAIQSIKIKNVEDPNEELAQSVSVLKFVDISQLPFFMKSSGEFKDFHRFFPDQFHLFKYSHLVLDHYQIPHWSSLEVHFFLLI